LLHVFDLRQTGGKSLRHGRSSSGVFSGPRFAVCPEG
jgi:hypothetical protein